MQLMDAVVRFGPRNRFSTLQRVTDNGQRCCSRAQCTVFGVALRRTRTSDACFTQSVPYLVDVVVKLGHSPEQGLKAKQLGENVDDDGPHRSCVDLESLRSKSIKR